MNNQAEFAENICHSNKAKGKDNRVNTANAYSGKNVTLQSYGSANLIYFSVKN